MIVHLEPITAIIIAVLLGWGWAEITDPGPICQVQEQHHGKTVLAPQRCTEALATK